MLRKIGIWIGTLLVSVLIGCSPTADDSKEIDHEPIGIIKKKIEKTSFGNEIGFQLHAPTYKNNEIASSLKVKGEVTSTNDLQENYIWLVINGSSGDSFEYYIPIENKKFSKEITVHEGKIPMSS